MPHASPPPLPPPQLLSPAQHPNLVRAMYGLLMLLPQGDAFRTLQTRLSVPTLALLSLGEGAPPAAAAGRGQQNSGGGGGKAQQEQQQRVDAQQLLRVFRERQQLLC